MLTKPLGALLLLTFSLAFGVLACEADTGREQDELYNSNLLAPGEWLFDPTGVAPVVAIEAPLRGVVATWESSLETQLELRSRRAGAWTAWEPIGEHWREGVRRVGRLVLATSPAIDAVQLRYRGAPPVAVVVEAFEGEELGQRTLPGRQTSSHTPLPSFVRPRSAWSARAPQASMSPMTPARVTIHHTGSSNQTSSAPEQLLRGWQNGHMAKGWSDIGYHFLVDASGQVWQGRELAYQGAHVGGHNGGNVGVSFMGTYTSHPPSAAQIASVGKLLAWLRDGFGVTLDAAHVKGHRDYAGHESNECPGDALHARLGELIAAAEQGATAPPKDPPPAPPPTEERLVGTVQDAASGAPLAGAEVAVAGQLLHVDRDGFFALELPAGRYEVTARAEGYQIGRVTCEVVASVAQNDCALSLAPRQAATPPPQSEVELALEGGCAIGGEEGADQAATAWLLALALAALLGRLSSRWGSSGRPRLRRADRTRRSYTGSGSRWGS